MPPEYIHYGTVSKKFDIFSLGVVIIKMVAGGEIYKDIDSEKIIELVWNKKSFFSSSLNKKYGVVFKIYINIEGYSIS